MKRLPLFLALAHFAVPVLTAAPDPSMDRIREGEAKQQQLRGDAQRLVEQLNGMIEEYARNGLGGDETQTVQALRDTLQRLSTDEMKQVIELLEKARGARDVGEAKQRVSDAYASQKAILTRMQQLLTEHLRNQQAQELAAQLAKLAERQAVNLQNGVSLGQWSGGKKPENFEAAMQANIQGQQAEQTAIAEELKALGQRVAQFAKEPENPEQAARFQKGLESVQKVLPNVDSAAEALKNGQLFKAVGDEKMARDALRKLAKEIAPPQDRVEALRTAQRELTKAMEDQKEIAKEVRKAAGEKDFDRWLDQQIAEKKVDGKMAKAPREELRKNPALQQRFAAQQKGKAEELPALENKQSDVAARSDELAQSLAKTAPEAARDVKASNDKMQEARGAMMDKDAPAAAKNAQEALAAMQAADAKLQQELSKAEALAGKSDDPVKDLQALQQQAQALAQQQAEAAKNPDKSGQPALAQKIDDLAKQAAVMAPAAAPAAQRAAANAQQAAQAGQPAAAAPAQQAAAQNLAQAAQQIAQQAAAAQQAQQQAAAAQLAQQQLAEIIVSEQKLQLETAKSVALATPGKPAPRSAFSGQVSRQQEISVRTDTLQTTLTPDLAAAGPSLRAAQSQMREAKQHLEKPDAKLAQTSEQKALDSLYEAQASLQQAAAQAQAALGQNPPQNPAAQQQAAAQLAQAQAALANANQALQQAQQAQAAAQAAQAAQQQAQQAAQQAQQAGNQPAAAQAQQQAQQAGQQAAAQQAAAQKAAQQAAAQLGQAAAQAGQAAAQAQPANSPAQKGAQAAAQAATQGAAQAAAQNIPGAQAQAAAAQQALAQAQTAMAQAQAGVTAANTPGMPGQPGSQPGPPGSQPGQQPGKIPGQTPGQPGSQAAEKYEPAGNEAVQTGSRSVANREAVFTSLPARDRAVIEQAQSEKYPEEYGAQVEQYLLNLARESAAKK